ncbi:MAG: electron transfer flavoprotein subunit beta/FixA family protein [Chloroflexi bacterium]|nr:electron transfer flavoprotein subunit beta/FixA family protein [Chloroflexota bacterium]
MDIIVCVKQIVDLRQLRIKRETREPMLEGLPVVISDIDKNALEAAVRLKEAGGGKVTVLSLSASSRLKETIKEALAMGADEAVLLVDAAFENTDPPFTARALAEAVRKIGKFDLLLLGEGSADNYTGQVGPRLAEMLGLPQATFAVGIEPTDGGLRVTRNLDEVVEVVDVPLPALVTVLTEVNQPRIPALTQILRAGKKPIAEWKAADLGLSAPTRLTEVMSNLAPAQERKGEMFEGEGAVEKFAAALEREGLIRQR